MQHKQNLEVGFTAFRMNEDKWARKAPFQENKPA